MSRELTIAEKIRRMANPTCYEDYLLSFTTTIKVYPLGSRPADEDMDPETLATERALASDDPLGELAKHFDGKES